MFKNLFFCLCSMALLWPMPALSYTPPADLKSLYEEDQADRVGPNALFGTKDGMLEMVKRDRLRKEKLETILLSGKISSGEDFYYAAMLLQHGEKADDILRAHVLAGISAQKGFDKAKWLSAASLDRYLMRVGQPQIFGTQYNKGEKTSWNQEPMNSGLISDEIRGLYGVPTLEKAKERLDQMNAGEKTGK